MSTPSRPRPSASLLRVVAGRGILPRPGWLERLLTSFDRHCVRPDTSLISDSELASLGLSRADLEAELRRPGWDAPLHWHRG